MSEQTYNFTIVASTESARDWATHAEAEDLVGTLAVARDLARDLDSRIELTDDAGFKRGIVEPSGDCATIARQREEIDALKAKLADFEQGRYVRGEFYAIEGNGGVWLQGRPSAAAFGLWFKGWADLARERPGLRPCGAITVGGGEKPLETYVVMRPIADLEPAP